MAAKMAPAKYKSLLHNLYDTQKVDGDIYDGFTQVCQSSRSIISNAGGFRHVPATWPPKKPPPPHNMCAIQREMAKNDVDVVNIQLTYN